MTDNRLTVGTIERFTEYRMGVTALEDERLHYRRANSVARSLRGQVGRGTTVDEELLTSLAQRVEEGDQQAADRIQSFVFSIGQLQQQANTEWIAADVLQRVPSLALWQSRGAYLRTRTGPMVGSEAIEFNEWRTTKVMPGAQLPLRPDRAADRDQSFALIMAYVSDTPWEGTSINRLMDAALEWPTDHDHGMDPVEVKAHQRRLRATLAELHHFYPEDVRAPVHRRVSEIDEPIYNGLMLLRSVEEHPSWVQGHKTNVNSILRRKLRTKFGSSWPVTPLTSDVLQEIDDEFAALGNNDFSRWRSAVAWAHSVDIKRVPAPWLPRPVALSDSSLTVAGFIDVIRDERRRGRIDGQRERAMVGAVERLITHVRPDDPLNEIVDVELVHTADERWLEDHPEPTARIRKQSTFFRDAVRLVHARRPWQVPDPFTRDEHQPIRTLEDLHRVPLFPAGLANVARYAEPRDIGTHQAKTQWRLHARNQITQCMLAIGTRDEASTAAITDDLLAAVEASSAPAPAKQVFNALHQASVMLAQIQSQAAADRANDVFSENYPIVVLDISAAGITVSTIEASEEVQPPVRALRNRRAPRPTTVAEAPVVTVEVQPERDQRPGISRADGIDV